MDITDLRSAAKLYDGSAVLRKDTAMTLASLNLDAAVVKADELTSVSSGYGAGSAFGMRGLDVTTLDLDIKKLDKTVDKSYDDKGVLRKDATMFLGHLHLHADSVKADKLVSISSGYGAGSTLKLSGTAEEKIEVLGPGFGYNGFKECG